MGPECKRTTGGRNEWEWGRGYTHIYTHIYDKDSIRKPTKHFEWGGGGSELVQSILYPSVELSQ
jgi:hypothetical protein